MFRCHLSGAYPPPPAFYLSKHASLIINAAKLRSAKLTICSQDKSLSLTGFSGPRLCLQMLNTLDSTPGRGRGAPFPLVSVPAPGTHIWVTQPRTQQPAREQGSRATGPTHHLGSSWKSTSYF